MHDVILQLVSLNGRQLLALSIFSSYFLLILWLFSRTLKSIGQASRALGARPNPIKTFLFWNLTAASFAHTWFYMFKYMARSFSNYGTTHAIATSGDILPRIADWLSAVSLFEEAWAAVCFGKINWWWSEQLCLFTVGAWTVFLYIEGSRHNIKHIWAYMFLGQVVAISVASNLFYLALLSSPPCPPSPPHTPVPKRLWIPVILALATIPLSPLTSTHTFLPNLLAMHALITLPLLSVPPAHLRPKTSRLSLNLNTLYLLIFLASIPIRSRTVLAATHVLPPADHSPLALLHTAWDVLHSHPAQSSIGWDVVWTTLSFVAWIVRSPADEGGGRGFRILYLIVATPFASVGVTAPYVLRPRGGEEGEGEGVKDE